MERGASTCAFMALRLEFMHACALLPQLHVLSISWDMVCR